MPTRSTLEAVGLWFDRGCPDPGYKYVDSSRVRRAQDLLCATPIRRSDWLPVGEDPSGGEQLRRSVESESCASEDDLDQCYDPDSEEENDAPDLETLEAWLFDGSPGNDGPDDADGLLRWVIRSARHARRAAHSAADHWFHTCERGVISECKKSNANHCRSIDSTS